jgi:nifR3 family TIM-barrel protein
MFTEFISAEGLIRDAAKSLQKLDIYTEERPVGVQIFGGVPESMRGAAQVVSRTEPDLLDINYGCPVKKVVDKGAGAAILKDPCFMEQLTADVIRSTHLPVTVKTRLGWDYDHINIVEVVLRLQDIGVKAVSIHARTRTQLYKGEANWDYIGQVTSHPDVEIPIFGNGDLDSPQKAKYNYETYGVSGLMIGRASIGAPWFFRQVKHYFATGELLPDPPLAERAAACRQHLEHSIRWKGPRVGLVEMRRHYANYFRNVPHFRDTRSLLVTADDPARVLDVLHALELGEWSFLPTPELEAVAELPPVRWEELDPEVVCAR